MRQIKDINKGDVFAFQGLDERYKAILCTSTLKVRRPFLFEFTALTIDTLIKPSLEDIVATDFYGKGNRYDEYFEYSEAEKLKMWRVHPEIKPYCLGSYGLGISRRDFMKARDHFHFLGNLNVVDHLDKHSGSGMNASDWDFLKEFFTDKFKTVFQERGLNTYRVAAIIRD
jgi:hypothetical protein